MLCSWQVEAFQANFRISAAVLNLNPRKLSTDALQAVWGLNQKLELLKIALEVRCCLCIVFPKTCTVSRAFRLCCAALCCAMLLLT